MSIESSDNLYIVGIGASAGGLEALNTLFENMPSNLPMAFVVVQHLSPNHESHMVKLLSKKTTMKVHQAKDDMKVIANNIYLIPPSKVMTIFNQRLYLSNRDENSEHLNLPIDVFLRSLAEDCANKAIAIILSGTGSDGTRGIRAIKQEDGIVVVQKAQTARFSGMPSNAIETGLVDYVLSPDLMGEKLAEFLKHPNYPEKNILDGEDSFNKILKIIKQDFATDFTYYKKSTISRRLERRMVINNAKNIEEYIKILESSSNELKILYQELLIGVTEFFRDKEAFSIIETKVLPEIFKKKKENQEFRAWVAGCSTGEEAYSLAILIKECLIKMDKRIPVKIFATDINENAIRSASLGQYSASITADISLDKLEKYFIKKGEVYQVKKEIREMVVFSRHNIIKDPPFHKLDLITCRNLLIYFQSKLQKQVISNFYFSLKECSFLFLGNSESLGEMISFFEVYNSKWKIYQCKKKEKNKLQKNYLNNLQYTKRISEDKGYSLPRAKTKMKNRKIEKINQSLLIKFLPCSVVIDENNELVHIVGDVNDYIKLPIDRLSLDILKIIPSNLSTTLGIAIKKIRRNKKEIIYKNIEFENKGKLISLDIKLVLLEGIEKEDYIVISFIERPNAEMEVVELEEDNENKYKQRIRDLEIELDYTQENLQSTIEELEASNEELQATNEELMASNEELQSTNEELESVNEELITVNSEHQEKIEELRLLNDDMDNLLKSTDIGTIFLDNKLQIRKFTPVIKEYFNIKDRDIGRPLSDISHFIEYKNILKDTSRVLDTLVPEEKEVKIKNERYYLMRILPYRSNSDIIKGVVLTFIDISELKSYNKNYNKLKASIEKSPFIYVLTSKDANIEYVNDKFLEVTQYNKDEVLGKKASILKSGQTPDELYRKLWKKISSANKWQGEFLNKKKDGSFFWEYAVIYPLLNDEKEISNYVKISRVIDNQKALQEEVKKLHKEKNSLQIQLKEAQDKWTEKKN
ncbi:MAG: chemotaxis protein CheB [Bacillota bacterium]